MVVATLTTESIDQKKLKLQKVWQTVHSNSCPNVYNFHMHTICSDGRLTPLEVVDQALAIGLKGLAITDHHSINGYRQAQAYLNEIQEQSPEKDLFSLWVGTEITSNLQGVTVHILAYAFDPEHSAIQPYLQSVAPIGNAANAEIVINSIQKAGGLAVLAHPFRYRRPAGELIPLVAYLGIDGIEAYYSYNKTNPWKASPNQTKESLELAFKYDLYTSCGTDTHGTNILLRL
ncbi:putative metal-dependent phosphoesterase, PHP family [Xenococcus sp. PCC 7305]|uniref:PHP domain-containing protein n=1 Tax=Xenococcus sp. PCC 7305 TaxID=102125 RepID=UPI0002ACFCC7|nr:PHP domain-containing protein [Xenococcus sp. PCC 7305]ELS01651.1 putative metal-dependent phosphoesterase, PHP family [Xenococcus sp. PCC 7305]